MRGGATGCVCIGALCVRKGGLADRGKTPENRVVGEAINDRLKKGVNEKRREKIFYEI